MLVGIIYNSILLSLYPLHSEKFLKYTEQANASFYATIRQRGSTAHKLITKVT